MGFSAQAELSTIRGELRDESIRRQKFAMTKLIEMDLNATTEASSAVVMDALHTRHAEDVGLKKLLYIFLSLNPNTVQDPGTFLRVGELLQRDMQPHNSPLVRAAAAKFMSCLSEPAPVTQAMALLRDAIRDTDPFVRKTAILSATRLYRNFPNLGGQANLADAIYNRLQDESPLVVVNAVAALRELRSTCGVEVVLGGDVVTALLQAMGEGSEWGQALILEAIGEHQAEGVEETRSIVERVLPSLNGANSAVVLGACRALLRVLDAGQAGIGTALASYEVEAKVAKALVRLLASSGADIQWAVLRCVKLVLQRWPTMLSSVDVRNFFVRYTDPPHIKLQKLDLLAYLPTPDSVTMVVAELKEYASDVDPEVGRRAVGVLGVLGASVDTCSDKVVSVLLELIATKHSSTLQAVVPALATILRRFPGQYEAAVAVLCQALDDVEDVAAKDAMVWMVGEYCERMEGGLDRLELCVDSWDEEATTTRLALLTAAAKLHLKVQTVEAGKVVKSILEKGNTDTSPDVRERALFYWRLLAHNPELAREVVLAPRPVPAPGEPQDDFNPLDISLVPSLPKLSALLGVPGDQFTLSTARAAPPPPPLTDAEKMEIRDVNSVLEPSTNLSVAPPSEGAIAPTASETTSEATTTAAPSAPVPAASADKSVDIFDLMTGLDISPVQDTNSSVPAAAPPSGPTPAITSAAPPAPRAIDPLDDLLGFALTPSAPAPAPAPVAAAAPAAPAPLIPKQPTLDALFPGSTVTSSQAAPSMSAIFGATPPVITSTPAATPAATQAEPLAAAPAPAAPAGPAPATATSTPPTSARSSGPLDVLAPPEASSSPTAAANAHISSLNSPFASVFAQDALGSTGNPFPAATPQSTPPQPAPAAPQMAPPAQNPAAAAVAAMAAAAAAGPIPGAATPQSPGGPFGMLQSQMSAQAAPSMHPTTGPLTAPMPGPATSMMMNGVGPSPWGMPAAQAAMPHPYGMAPQNGVMASPPQPVYQQQYTGMMSPRQPPPGAYQTQYTGGMMMPQHTGGYQQQYTGGMMPPQPSPQPYQTQYTGGYEPQYTGGHMMAQSMDPSRMSGAFNQFNSFTGGHPGMRPAYPAGPNSFTAGHTGMRQSMQMPQGGMNPMQQSYGAFGASVAFAPGQMGQMAQMATGGPLQSQMSLGGGGYVTQLTGGGPMGTGVAPPPPKVLLRHEDGLGLGVRGQFVGRRSTGYMRYRLELVNSTQQALTEFLIQFNHNQLGLAPVKVAMDVPPIHPGASAAVEVACCIKPSHVSNNTSNLQVAIKPKEWERAVYFNDDLPYHMMD